MKSKDGMNREIDEKMAYNYAVAAQGYEGTYADWLAMDMDERDEYEAGAAGIPTS